MWIFIIFFLYTDSLQTYKLEETIVKDSLIKQEIQTYTEIQTFLPINIFSSNGLGSIDINGNGSTRSIISFNGVMINLPQNNFYSLTRIPQLLIDYIKMSNASIVSNGKGTIYLKTSSSPNIIFMFENDYAKNMQFSFNISNTNIKAGITDIDNHFNEESRIKSPNNYKKQTYFFITNKYFPIVYFSSLYQGIPSNSFEILHTSRILSNEAIVGIKNNNLYISLHYTNDHYIKNEGMYYYNDIHKNYTLKTSYLINYKSFPIKPYIKYERINSTKIGIKDRLLYGINIGFTYKNITLNIKQTLNKTQYIIPSINIDYSKKIFAIKVGTFTHLPSFNDLYWPRTTFAEGNPDLKEEKGVYADFRIKKGIFNIELYTSIVYNGIIWQNSGDIWGPYNESMFLNTSLIFEIDYKNIHFYINPRITRTMQYWIPYKPVYLMGLSYTKQIGLSICGINLYSKGFYYTSVSNVDRIDGYTIISPFIKIKYKDFLIKYEIYNITNTIYEEPYGYESNGRTFNIFIKIGG